MDDKEHEEKKHEIHEKHLKTDFKLMRDDTRPNTPLDEIGINHNHGYTLKSASEEKSHWLTPNGDVHSSKRLSAASDLEYEIKALNIEEESTSMQHKHINNRSESSVNTKGIYENIIKSDSPLSYSTISTKASRRSHLAGLFKVVSQVIPFIPDPYYDFLSEPKWFLRHPGTLVFDNKALKENGKRVKILEDSKYGAKELKTVRQSVDLAYALTATYPIMKDPISGRMQMLNYPNADAFFMIGSNEYLFGGLYDGSGIGANAYYASNVAALEAVNCFMEFKKTFPVAYSRRAILSFLKKTVLSCHRRLLGIDECGSTTLVNYLMTRGPDPTSYCLYYIILGDVELMRFNSLGKKWESLNQPDKNIRLNTGYTPGGIGHGWETPDGDILPNTNLYYNYTNLNPNDIILISSDGLGDAIDPVQNGRPCDIGITQTNKWEEVAAYTPDMSGLCKKIAKYKSKVLQEALEVTAESSLKQKLNQLIEFLFFITSGERDLYLNNPKYNTAGRVDKERMFKQAKKDFKYEKIFGKLDHIGVQMFRPTILDTFEVEED